jgi:hypothetical protein
LFSTDYRAQQRRSRIKTCHTFFKFFGLLKRLFYHYMLFCSLFWVVLFSVFNCCGASICLS